jgi:hypothetical protein
MKKSNDIPEWMKERTIHVIYLRDIGYDSSTLSNATNSDVKKWYEAEKTKQGSPPC